VPHTITLDDAAYERLGTERRDGESFSDVIDRLTGVRSWDEVLGIWPEGNDLEAAIADGRARSERRRDELADELSER